MVYAVLLWAQDAKDGGAPGWSFFLPIMLMLVAMYVLLILPQRRREQKQREMLLSALKKNDEVLTTAGIIGIVANIKENEDEVTLKVDESANVRLRVLKSSIIRILHPKDQPKDGAGRPTETGVKAGPPK